MLYNFTPKLGKCYNSLGSAVHCKINFRMGQLLAHSLIAFYLKSVELQ